MKARSRITLSAIFALTYLLWMSILSSTLSEPAMADGVTFDEFYSARESLGEQLKEVTSDSNNQFYQMRDFVFEVKLTGGELSGIFNIERSMQSRLDLKDSRKVRLFWNAVLATTLLLLLVLAGLKWCRSTPQNETLHSHTK